MKCPECGNEVEESDRYCKRCGKNLAFFRKNKNEDETEKAAEHAERTAEITAETVAPSDILSKGKLLKHSLKAILCAFVVLVFLSFILPVDGFTGVSVYRCAAAGHYGDGLDGRWDNVVFIAELLANMFSKVDSVITPCAFMIFMAFFGLCFALAWPLSLLMKRKSVVCKAEIGFLIFYALFAVVDIILICGLKYVYNSYVGSAPRVLLVIAVFCFAGSLALYIVRKKYFQKHKELISALQVTFL